MTTHFIRICCVILLLTACVPASAAPFYGTGRAGDGDSFMVGDKEVRLFGIDAPEFSQTCERDGWDWACGAQAADRLKQLVNGKSVHWDYGDSLLNHRNSRIALYATCVSRTAGSTVARFNPPPTFQRR